jgi:hypothetical protein
LRQRLWKIGARVVKSPRRICPPFGLEKSGFPEKGRGIKKRG